MPTVEFRKEQFVKSDFDDYHVEFKIQEIGQGSNLLIEKKNEDGEYEMVQVPIRRLNESMFICFSEPQDGRLIFEK